MKTIDEEIKINDQLNPALWGNNELKEDVKEKLLAIVDNFLDGLKEDKINISVVDIRLLGSNANYNYTDKSDIDLHIVADFSSTPCEQNVMPQLYNAYRSLFSKTYDIKINGYGVELYVEDVNQPAKSNGVYSLYTGWVSEPKKDTIPEINYDEFEKVFDEWEDKYFDIVGEHSNELEEDYSFKDDYGDLVSIELQSLNDFLDKYGFEVELIEDADILDDIDWENSVGMFLNSIQDDASVFPIALNKDYILNNVDDKTDLVYAIRGTLWHEAGHGIFNYLEDMYDLSALGEEEVVEEFARYMEDSELYDILQQYVSGDLEEHLGTNVNEGKKETILYRGEGAKTKIPNNLSKLAGKFYALDKLDCRYYAKDDNHIYTYKLDDNAKIKKARVSTEVGDASWSTNKYKELEELTSNIESQYYEDIIFDNIQEFIELGEVDNYFYENTFEFYSVLNWMNQVVNRIELEKQGYDGIFYKEEDGVPQYQIWNDKVVHQINNINEAYANNIDKDILDTIKNPLDKLYKNTKCSKSVGTWLDKYFYEIDESIKLCVGNIKHKGDTTNSKTINHTWLEIGDKVLETNFPDGDYERVLVDSLDLDRNEDLYNQVEEFLNKSNLNEALTTDNYYRYEILEDGKLVGGLFKGAGELMGALKLPTETYDKIFHVIGKELPKPDINYNGYDSDLIRSAFTEEGVKKFDTILKEIKDELKQNNITLVKKKVNPDEDAIIYGDDYQIVYYDDMANVEPLQERKAIDLTGQQFGELTVLGRDTSRKGNDTYWLCKCSCGKETSVARKHLINGDIKSCGHLKSQCGKDHTDNFDGMRSRQDKYHTNLEVIRNQTLPSNNTSGVKGVDYHKTRKMWRARIYANGKEITKWFKDFNDAVAWRKNAEKQYYQPQIDKAIENGDLKEDLNDYGYHAGDLGKSEQRERQTGGRNTGHFGTGTYFVGDPEKIKGYNDNQYGKGEAPHHIVDFSSYNLYKPSTNDYGYKLHDALANINNGYKYFTKNAKDYDYFISKGINARNSGEFELKDIPEIVEHLNNLLGSYDHIDLPNDIDFNTIEQEEDDEWDRLYDELKPKCDNTVDLFDAIDNEMAKNDKFEKVRQLVKEIRECIEDELTSNIIRRYGDHKNLISQLVTALEGRHSEEQVAQALEEVNKHLDDTKGDSLSTIFMKALGYEGVDTRHLQDDGSWAGLDNTTYGSVIYDLKPETIVEGK